MSKTLDFHMQAFADPLPRPAVWTHADVYPNFAVWGWNVALEPPPALDSRAAITSQSRVPLGVREWLPAGNTMPQVQLTIQTRGSSIGQLKPYTVTMVRMRDGQTRRAP